MSDVALKPCPFCGGEASRFDNGKEQWVECCGDDCPVYPETLTHRSAEDVANAWNRRAQQEPAGEPEDT